MWVVDERWAFRFPRRAIAVPGVERELSVLPRVAPLLPVPVPVARVRRRGERALSVAVLRAPAVARRRAGGCGSLRGRAGEGRRAVGPVPPRPACACDPGRSRRRRHAARRSNRRADMAVPRADARASARGAVEELGRWTARRVEQILAAAPRSSPPSTGEACSCTATCISVTCSSSRARCAASSTGATSASGIRPSTSCSSGACCPGSARGFFEEYGPIDDETALRARVPRDLLSPCSPSMPTTRDSRALERETRAGLERTLVD